MDNFRKSKFGENHIGSYYKKLGYKVVGRSKGEKGFDLLATKNGKKLKIEVKTTDNSSGGIPDMHNTEFKKVKGKWFFVADRLCIVRVKGKKLIKTEILQRQQIDKYQDSHKTVIRIRTTKLDKDLKNNRIKLSRE